MCPGKTSKTGIREKRTKKDEFLSLVLVREKSRDGAYFGWGFLFPTTKCLGAASQNHRHRKQSHILTVHVRTLYKIWIDGYETKHKYSTFRFYQKTSTQNSCSFLPDVFSWGEVLRCKKIIPRPYHIISSKGEILELSLVPNKLWLKTEGGGRWLKVFFSLFFTKKYFPGSC